MYYSVAGHSLDENNDVFQDVTSFTCFHSELRLRRATVAGDLTTELQSSFSTGDLPALVEQQTRAKSRPKSFFPVRGDELTNWQRSTSSDSSDDLDLLLADTNALTEQSWLNVLLLHFCDVKCADRNKSDDD